MSIAIPKKREQSSEEARKNKRCVLGSLVAWRELSGLSLVGVGFGLPRDRPRFSLIRSNIMWCSGTYCRNSLELSPDL